MVSFWTPRRHSSSLVLASFTTWNGSATWVAPGSGVPVTTEHDSDLVHGPGVTADLFGDPPSGPIRQHQSLGCDARLVLGPAAARTGRLRAVPPELVPHEAGGTAERGKIDKGNHRTVLHPGEHGHL